MIYDRPTGAHRPAVRGLAGAVLVAMLVLGFLGYPPKITAQTVTWRDATGLPALDGSNASGRAAPVPLDVRLDGSYPVSVSTTPTLVWKGVPAAAGNQVAFTITSLAEKNPAVIWRGTAAVGSDRTAAAKVAAGVLAQGRTYAWSATSTANKDVRSPVHGVTVDVQRSGSQPVFNAGNLSVTEGTGELVYTYQGPKMPALAGPIGWTLVHRPSNTPQKGLPGGWRLVVTGSTGWEAIRANDDGSVTLSTGTGVSVTYVKRGDNQWAPQVGRFNVAGETTFLSENADGTFSATDGNRIVTVLSKPTVNQSGHPLRVWAQEAPTPQLAWRDGRPAGVTDPVTQNAIAFLYSGDQGCVAETDPGFVKAPPGMLCGAIDSLGSAVMLEYVETPAGVQIGRIVNGLGMGVYAQSSDIGWDDSGRIVEVRDPLAATAVASGRVAGLDAQDTRVLTQIAYDAQGRVASLTAPAGLTTGAGRPERGEQRAVKRFSYAPFTVRTDGVTTPSGFDRRDVLDPLSLQIDRQIDENGVVVATTYDANGSPVRVEDRSSGTVTVTRYDAQGRPVAQMGPTKGALDAPTAPLTTTAYDQDEQGRDWTGLAVRYWDNAGFNGAPVGGSTGPVLNGSAVGSLAFNWTSSPAGGSGPWAARMTGIFEAPQDGAYTFTSATSARLWVNGRSCAAAACTVELGKGGTAGLQVDVVSSDGSAAGVKVLVTGPSGTQAPVPTTQLRPNYGLTTSTTVRENDGHGLRELVTRMVYDPVTTQLLKTISPSGATISRTYEPYDPAKGLWGRSVSVTDASGKTTTSSFYGAGESAPDCSGAQVPQDGGVKAVNLPGGRVVSAVSAPGAGPLSSGDGASTACAAVGDADLSMSTTTSGLGAAVEEITVPMLGGDPLANGTVVRTQGETTYAYAKVDTNGNVWKSVDAHGTVTVRQWDPLTGNLTRVVETTRDDQSRTLEYTYTAGGEVATVTANGHRLLENEYANDGTLLRTRLGNGAVRTYELDQNNNLRKTTTSFPDGTTLVESMVHSPSGRLLSRTLAGPSGTSTYTYDYNVDGRLTQTRLTGTIPTTETAWSSEYAGADGRNGNRSSLTTTRADGTTTTTGFTYGSDNRLVSSTDPQVGEVQYDAAGRATRIGGVSLEYDAAGAVISASDAKRAYRFSDAGTTTTLTQTVDGTPQTVTATTSGETLVLGADKRIEAQIVSPAPGFQVVFDATGAPARWVYDDAQGNATWSSVVGRAPTRTQLYSPDGNEVGVVRTSTATPIGLLLDAMGWQNGSGATRLRLSTPISIIGARAYSSDGGRWLQSDPTVNGAMNAYEYAAGDPINLADPTGNAPWGLIAGAVAAAVTGALIGALTFGFGGVAVVGYGYGALAAQIGLGLVSGAIEGVVAEVVTQMVDGASWSGINWASVGIAAGIGAGIGALTAGSVAAYVKVKRPRANLLKMDLKRLDGIELDAEAVKAIKARHASTFKGSMQKADQNWKQWVKQANDAGVDPGWRIQSMFSQKRWNRRVAKVESRWANDDVFGDALLLGDNAGGSAKQSFKIISGEADDLSANAMRLTQQKKVMNSLDLVDEANFKGYVGFQQQAKGAPADEVYGKISRQQNASYKQNKLLSEEIERASQSSSGEYFETANVEQEFFQKYMESLFK